MHTHLKSVHAIDLVPEKLPQITSQQGPSELSEASASGSGLQKHVNYELTTPIGQSKKRKITEYFQSSNSMEATVSRMAARDGLPFAKFCSSADLRRLFKKSGYDGLPSTPRSIKNIVMNYSKKEKKTMIAELKEMQKSDIKFSLTFDEWTSSRNRRYMNVNLHTGTPFKDGSSFKNLGLVRIDGSMPATTCIRLLSEKLAEFELSLDGDIVAITTDGASVMCKVGRDVNAWHQQCLAHGIQLAVVDVLYAKTDTVDVDHEHILFHDDVTYDEDEESDVEDMHGFAVERDESSTNSYNINPHYKEIITKVRNVVKLFKNSPTKNDIYLQKYVKQQESKNLALILDCKTRWSSMADMIERFNRLKLCVRKALLDIKSDISFSDAELEMLEGIQRSLKVVKSTVVFLCRRETTLLTAHTALKYMIKTLQNQNTNLAQQLAESLQKRVHQRKTPLPSILQYLQNPEAYFNDQNADKEEGLTYKMSSGEITLLMADLIKRFKSTERDNSAPPTDTANTSASDDSFDPCSFEKQLDKEITKSLDNKNRSQLTQPEGGESSVHDNESLLTLLRIEMTLYENGGKRGQFLDDVFKYLMTIPPTSVESERAFSAASYVCNKVRSSLNDNTLDALCFLKTIFEQQSAQTV